MFILELNRGEQLISTRNKIKFVLNSLEPFFKNLVNIEVTMTLF